MPDIQTSGVAQVSSEVMTRPVTNAYVVTMQRIKVHIRCRHCGETFILRGVKDGKGHIETGFKRCLCNNERDFDVEPIM